ncbi:MAG TPA: TolC family protein [Pyrinomonadaceae bacterium]|nr:TolC family protein [Pyrinomonadaceae bacterium]
MAGRLHLIFVVAVCAALAGAAHGRQASPATQTPTPQPTPAQTPSPAQTPQTPPPTAPNVTPGQPSAQGVQSNSPGQVSLDEALRLANAQVSGLRQAELSERVAEEDVRQARAAFLPKVSAPLDYIYTSPTLSRPLGEPRVQSYIANNAISEYQALVNVSGDLDLSGRLRATLARNRALLDSARAGTEVARRALRQATVEAYYALALASAERRAAEQNLDAAREFEHITSLLLSGGEVASVDLTRAQLQTNQREGELEQARAAEEVAAAALRVFVGYEQARAISAADLSTLTPAPGEVERFTTETVKRRPEFAQFEAQERAAEQDILVARADRRPQLSYTLNGGFDTDSLRPPRLKEHTGVSAAVNLSIPIFDWGASKSRERQARVRLQIAQNERAQAERGFAQEFGAARVQALSASTRIRLASEGVRLAENNLSTSIARYRAGEAQIVEVTDAQTTLAAQRLAFFQALFDYQLALARLRQAAGQ